MGRLSTHHCCSGGKAFGGLAQVLVNGREQRLEGARAHALLSVKEEWKTMMKAKARHS